MRILYVSGFDLHSETLNANSVCSKELIRCISLFKDLEVNIGCEHIRPVEGTFSLRNDFRFTLSRIIKWPCMDSDAEKRCYDEIEKEQSENKYDAIIVCHKPEETLTAAIRYKKKHPAVNMYLYSLDPVDNEVDHSIGHRRYLVPLAKRTEKQALKFFDGIFQMECNRSRFQSNRYRSFEDKIYYVDFPLINNLHNPSFSGVPYNDNKIKLFYSGTLKRSFRSPKYIAEVLSEVSSCTDLKMSFYSKGDCEEYLEELSARNSIFEACGYVPKEKLDAVMKDADVYVNIGNKYSSMLPSKLLSYFEQGKPIIHVSNQDGDACLSYMERYPLGLVINEGDPVEISAARVSEFLRGTYGQRVSSEEICKIFYKNTPEWSAGEIVKVIRKDIKG